MSQAGKALVAGKGHRQMLEGVRRGLEEGGGVVQFCQRCGGVGRALLAEGAQCCSQAELTAVAREEMGRPSSILQPKVGVMAIMMMRTKTTGLIISCFRPETRRRRSTSSPRPPPPSWPPR
jgi:hypothetical protein